MNDEQLKTVNKHLKLAMSGIADAQDTLEDLKEILGGVKIAVEDYQTTMAMLLEDLS
jgi:hypothetical protein